MKYKHFQNHEHAVEAFHVATQLTHEIEPGQYRRILDPRTGRAGNMCAYKYNDGSKKVVFDSWEVAREVYPKMKEEDFIWTFVRKMTEVIEVPALEVK